MNQVSTLYNYIKSLAEADEYINTVTKVGTIDVLEDKGTILPLLDVFITGASYPSPQVKRFSIELTCLNQRDQTNETTTDKFWEMDNEVDNLNETEAALNRIWLNMFRDFEENNITASESPTLLPILEGKTTIVDGWILSFEVDVPNTEISLCI